MNETVSPYIRIKTYFKDSGEIIDILYTSSVFRMDNPYKKTHAYYIGLVNIIKGIYDLRKHTNKNIILRLYIDKNMMYPNMHHQLIQDELIDTWIPLFKKMHKIKWIQLATYNAPLFLDKNKIYHISTFGTIIRLLPIFEQNTINNIKTIVNIDIDSTASLIIMSNDISEVVTKDNIDFSYMSFQHDTTRDRVKHYNIFKYYPIKHTAALGLCVFKTRLPISLLNEFLYNFINFKNANNEFKSYIITRIKEIKNIDEIDETQLTIQDLIFYGCDEFFLHDYIIKYMLDKQYLITYTLIPKPLRLLSLLKRDYLKHQQQHIDYMMKHLPFKRFNQMLAIIYNIDQKINPDQQFISLFKKIAVRLMQLIKTDLFIQDIDNLPQIERNVTHTVMKQYLEDNATYIQFNQKLILVQ